MLLIRVGTKVEKQHSKLRQQKRTNIRRFTRALTLIGYRTPSKLDYCFKRVLVLFLSLLILGFSIAGLRNDTKAANNTASTFLENAHIIDHTFRLHKCACANIKVGMAAKLPREKFSFEQIQIFRTFDPSQLLINSKCSLSVENTVYSISDLTIYYFIVKSSLSQCMYNNDLLIMIVL